MTEARQREIFDEWLNGYTPLLFKVVRAYASNLEDQSDLFQDIATQVWRSVPNFRRESAVSTWLYRIALNTALKWIRKEKRYKDNEYDFEKIEHLLHQKEDENLDDRLTWLYDQIHSLNEVDRSICLLMMDGFSYKEMADILGIGESNIGVKIYRIKKQLIEQSKKIEDHGI